jgi:hypothetical protein
MPEFPWMKISDIYTILNLIDRLAGRCPFTVTHRVNKYETAYAATLPVRTAVFGGCFRPESQHHVERRDVQDQLVLHGTRMLKLKPLSCCCLEMSVLSE